MATNVMLYEGLKPTLGVEAAKMLTEAIGERDQLATKQDLRDELVRFRAEFKAEFKAEMIEIVDARCTRVEATLMRWMLTFFVPLWLGVWATVAALALTR